MTSLIKNAVKSQKIFRKMYRIADVFSNSRKASALQCESDTDLQPDQTVPQAQAQAKPHASQYRRLHPAEPDDALLTQHLLHTSKAWQTACPSSTCRYQENSFYTPLKHRQLEQNALL
ncbi:hypothetical protein ACSLNH_10145 [Comamonas kerstersii]|uniref:hypothetical protein n=1 Tax=Comamonas kerstersii TaxID=225992 RepID=UPI003EE39311